MFHIQTKANYMTHTILVGGAKYRGTGRGFVTQHTHMDEQYRLFAPSHVYLGVKMGAGLIIMGIWAQQPSSTLVLLGLSGCPRFCALLVRPVPTLSPLIGIWSLLTMLSGSRGCVKPPEEPHTAVRSGQSKKNSFYSKILLAS